MAKTRSLCLTFVRYWLKYSVVGIATRYELDGLGSSPSGGETSHTRPDWVLRPKQSPVKWVPCLFKAGTAAGAWR